MAKDKKIEDEALYPVCLCSRSALLSAIFTSSSESNRLLP